MVKWRTFIQPPRQGASHIRRGNIPCQDDAAVMESRKRIAAVLADGVGSLEYSDLAAKAVTEAAAGFLLQYDYRGFCMENLKEALLTWCRSVLEQKADQAGISPTEMDCTLLFLLILKNESKIILGQLGDGMVCGVKKDQAVQFFAADDGVKAGSNMTKTVLSSDAADSFRAAVIPFEDWFGFFLTSDGLENELYSTAGKVKQTIQWYFNRISNQCDEECIREINDRWDKLTEEEAFGFTDDMSLAAVVLPGRRIELPEEANWLCICGHRNRMESSRCEQCGKDITKVYKGVSFKPYGGKREFFLEMNRNPEAEEKMLWEHCVYEKEKKSEDRQVIGQSEEADGSSETEILQLEAAVMTECENTVFKWPDRKFFIYPVLGLLLFLLGFGSGWMAGMLSDYLAWKDFCESENLAGMTEEEGAREGIILVSDGGDYYVLRYGKESEKTATPSEADR